METPTEVQPQARDEKSRLTWQTWFVILFGIALPVGAVVTEWVTHICAECFFDPVPTYWHAALYLSIGAANLWALTVMRGGQGGRSCWLLAANGVAVGMAALYSVVFLPLMPIALFAIAAMGLGFCALSPALALASSLLCRAHLLKHSLVDTRRGWVWWVGLVAPVVVLCGLSVPANLTRVGLGMAADDAPERQARGLRWLRRFGDEQEVLRACYGRRQWAADPGGMFLTATTDVTTEDARKLYYRLTGQAFNSVPPPKLTASRRWDPLDDFAFDEDQGAAAVAGRLRGLSLVSSQFDGSVDPAAALAYVEWTLVFRNDSQVRREARAQVALPPGGVVSRATLWVDGEEREAAFAQRGKARQAYEQVVQRQRDPLLVTTVGPDRVLVQCFPVPADGGEMKIRLGVTSPLRLAQRADRQGLLRLPCFVERNFRVAPTLKHRVWVESEQPLKGAVPALAREHPDRDTWALRGALTEAQLTGPEGVLKATRPAAAPEVWTPDPVSGALLAIRQRVHKQVRPAPKQVVLVVDCSRRMKPHLPVISAVARNALAGVPVTCVLAGDEVTSQTGERALRQLAEARCLGGADNVPALVEAWELAVRTPDSAIVWVHGAQPVVLQPVERLTQRFRRRPNAVRLYDFAVDFSPNRVAEKLCDLPAVGVVPRLRTVEEDFRRLLRSWQSQASAGVVFKREQVDRTSVEATAGEGAKETSAHLARLWALDRVTALLHSKAPEAHEQAVQLSVTYQLVTPVSGAVVLENPSQYENAGLQPVDPATVPTIPEPETWLLLLLAAVVLAVAIWRREREGAGCPAS